MKSKFLLLLTVLTLASCATQKNGKQPISLASQEKPDLSIIHMKGRITYVPKISKWPAAVKAGATWECVAVIDNRVPDSDSNPQRGFFIQPGLPAHCHLVMGDTFRIVSSPSKNGDFRAYVRDGSPLNDDVFGINFSAVSMPGLPDITQAKFQFSLGSKNPDIIKNDSLPIRSIKLRDLDGGYASRFSAYLTNSDQGIRGTLSKFEVFQASADTPIGPPAP